MIYLNYPSLTTGSAPVLRDVPSLATGSAPVLRDGFRDSCCKQIIDQKTGAQNRKYRTGGGAERQFWEVRGAR